MRESANVRLSRMFGHVKDQLHFMRLDECSVATEGGSFYISRQKFAS